MDDKRQKNQLVLAFMEESRYGLRGQVPARPTPYASDPVLVHRLARLLHASFRPRLTATPLRFATTSPPSGCRGDFHPRAVEHARHTKSWAGKFCRPASISSLSFPITRADSPDR